MTTKAEFRNACAEYREEYRLFLSRLRDNGGVSSFALADPVRRAKAKVDMLREALELGM